MTDRGGTFALPVAVLLAALISGCGLSAAQKQDINRWEAEAAHLGHPEVRYAEEVDPGSAVGLSFLPFGIGGFYVHRPGLGVTGILFWPLSITWTPAVAYGSAHYYNYTLFQRRLAMLRAENPAPVSEVADVHTRLQRAEQLWKENTISAEEYEGIRHKVLRDLAE